MPIGPSGYPTIVQVTNLVRSLVQDDMAGATETLGEGQIFVDPTSLSVTMSNFFNSAFRTLCRKLRTTTGPMLIYDNYLFIGVPPLQSPTMGLAAPDPSVQVNIGYEGYFNGVTVNSQWLLPGYCLMVERVWERINGSNFAFLPLNESKQGLPSSRQNIYNTIWEYRNDAIWMPGSVQTMDIRIRFQGQLAQIYNQGIDTSSTYIPINDCQDALAGLMIQNIGIRQGAAVLPAAMEWANDQVNDFLNEWVKREQGMPYTVNSFSGGGGGGNNSNGGNS